MSDPQPRLDPPRSDSASGQQQAKMADGTCRVPAWDRERLIDQFRRIDGSTRSEAEWEIAALERSLWTQFADPTAAGPLRGRAKK